MGQKMDQPIKKIFTLPVCLSPTGAIAAGSGDSVDGADWNSTKRLSSSTIRYRHHYHLYIMSPASLQSHAEVEVELLSMEGRKIV